MKYIQPASKKRTIKRMLEPITKDIWWSMILHGIAGGLIPVLTVFSMEWVTSRLLKSNVEIQEVIKVIAFVSLAGFCLETIKIQTEKRTYNKIGYFRMDFLKELMHKTMTMDLKYYENPEFADEMESCIIAVQSNTNGIEGIYHTVYLLSAKLLGAILLAIILTQVNFWIVVVTVLSILVTFWTLGKVSDARYKRKEELNQAERRNYGYGNLTTDFSYGKDIRIYNFQNRFLQSYENEIKNLEGIYKDISLIEGKFSLLSILGLVFADLFAYYILTTNGMMTFQVSEFVMYLTATSIFSLLMNEITEDFANIHREFAYCKDTIGFLDMNLITDESDKRYAPIKPISVEFEHVSFKYPNSKKYVFEDLSFRIKPSEKLALVGVNGAGKTTIVKLLTGLYRPTSGRILIDGIDYTRFSIEDLHELFGVVFQDIEPLAVTIKENVAASSNDIDEKRVEMTLRQVELWDKTSQYEKGIDQMLLKIIDEDGAVLSGGENQKLMIARAIYRKGTQMMIMDEPTASLDALAEEKIYREFDQIMQGKTALFISHRLASTLFCDRILLLDGGKVSEEGTHDELLSHDGLYAHMFKTQGKYYQEVKENEKQASIQSI
jgi:ABC-type multidrug transport system fused ATPase/permease subunit